MIQTAVGGIGCGEHHNALFTNRACLPVMHRRWCVQAQTGMVVVVVIPIKERLAESAGILDTTD